MKRAIPPIVTMLFMIGAVVHAQTQQAKETKTEADVIINSYLEAVSQVDSLKGLDKSKPVGVLFIQNATGSTLSLGSTGQVALRALTNIPLVGMLVKSDVTDLTVADSEEARGGRYSRSPAGEDLLIEQLRSKGFTVRELNLAYYGDPSGAIGTPPTLENIGKRLGVDQVIIGSNAGSVRKISSHETHFRRIQSLSVDTRLNLRIVDTQSNQVLDAQTFGGHDTIDLVNSFKLGNVLGDFGFVAATIITLILINA